MKSGSESEDRRTLDQHVDSQGPRRCTKTAKVYARSRKTREDTRTAQIVMELSQAMFSAPCSMGRASRWRGGGVGSLAGTILVNANHFSLCSVQDDPSGRPQRSGVIAKALHIGLRRGAPGDNPSFGAMDSNTCVGCCPRSSTARHYISPALVSERLRPVWEDAPKSM